MNFLKNIGIIKGSCELKTKQKRAGSQTPDLLLSCSIIAVIHLLSP